MVEERGAAPEVFVAELRTEVLWVQWRRNVSVSDSDAAALIERSNVLCREVCPPMLVELNGMVSLTRSALHGFATALNIAAMAIVGPSAVDRTLADFFARVHNPPYPTRYFECPAEALAWLTGHPYGP
ncbi:DUF7793 family protein [Arthrobacter sp. MDT2-2]|jgi:hypothetical protein